MKVEKVSYPLRFTSDKKRNIRIASAIEGVSINEYINKAIDEKLERDGERNDY